MDWEAQLNVKQSHYNQSNHIQLLPLKARPQKSVRAHSKKHIIYHLLSSTKLG